MLRNCLFFMSILAFSVCVAQNNNPTRSPNETKLKSLEGFLDIRWGESLVSAKAKLLKRSGTELEATDSENLVCKGGQFGGEDVAWMTLSFLRDKFIFAAVEFVKVADHQVLPKYRQIKELIKEKYGEPKEDLYIFKSPYREGDGYELQAIKSGKGTVRSTWKFPSEDGFRDFSMSLYIDDDGSITVDYADDLGLSEMQQADKKQKSKEF